MSGTPIRVLVRYRAQPGEAEATCRETPRLTAFIASARDLLAGCEVPADWQVADLDGLAKMRALYWPVGWHLIQHRQSAGT